ncbi:uncharacterized protein ASCRUDRAFT_77853 [Ascoidea rubescens DSM 1968]|uniref:RGS domain-containing protein n=1 Tax=Ascoidea rubescens DSM 1968 TaxID=1344418 RepID=A0A1D2VAJ3_9ASCO|nr:hypothetical protein ASCRUDRAFT_77853 [Ascoidea rubescens DSM 1968]ODV58619.1 hypothetical protein ASCRUDRAFT_77853 [Ascoidea rubescens DSM 1968]
MTHSPHSAAILPLSSLLSESLSQLYGRTSERLNRLPTLFEVLNRKTLPPVDLWSFYVFMRDNQHAVDYLDFWIDVVSHLALCKQYVKGLRESVLETPLSMPSLPDIRTSTNPSIAPTQSKKHSNSTISGPATITGTQGTTVANSPFQRNSVSSSILLEALVNDGVLDDSNPKRLSSFLRGDEQVNDPVISSYIERYQNSKSPITNRFSHKKNDSAILPAIQKVYDSYTNEKNTKNNEFPLPSPLTENISEKERINFINKSGTQTSATSGPAGLATISPEMVEQMLNDDENINYNSKDHLKDKITRDDLRLSSRRILVTYFIDNSEKKLQLPDRITRSIHHAIEIQGRDDPEVFDESRDYVFQAMEREAFPNFLKYAALNNITVKSYNFRLAIGLFFLFSGFWIGYTLIFLGYKPSSARPVVTVPFFFGSYFILTAIFRLDPVLCFAKYCETNTLHESTDDYPYTRNTSSPNAVARKLGLMKIKEHYVGTLLIKRSIWVLILICLASAAFSILFSLVPEHRL